MSTLTETRAEAWRRREALRGEVDFTMMYVAHDAFSRDLDRLSGAASNDTLLLAPARGTWALFARMLHLHHSSEDAALWPRLRQAVTSPGEHAVLDQMEAEHAGLEPVVESIASAYADDRADEVARGLEALGTGLREHMLHEENAALPLLERALGPEGWRSFGEEVRDRVEPHDVSVMMPWMLDGALPEAAARVLGPMPLPVRALYRTVWAPHYRRTELLHEDVR